MDTEQGVLLHDKLREYFGFSSFKGNQEAVISNVLAGKDTFVLMPTGGENRCATSFQPSLWTVWRL